MAGERPRRRSGRGAAWSGGILVVVGCLFSLGFFMVPPQVLIPELVRNPGLLPLPEVLVGIWAIVVGVGVLIVSAISRSRARSR